MPIHVAWCEQYEAVICVDLILPWDWDDFRVALQQQQDLIKELGQVKAFLIDVRAAGDFPPSGFIRNSRYALNLLPLVPMIFLSETQMMPMLMTPVISIMRTKRAYHFVHSEEKVAEIITDILANG